jgi:hypothetical protein
MSWELYGVFFGNSSLSETYQIGTNLSPDGVTGVYDYKAASNLR